MDVKDFTRRFCASLIPPSSLGNSKIQVEWDVDLTFVVLYSLLNKRCQIGYR